MKKKLTIMVVLILVGLVTLPSAAQEDRASQVLERFFQASGGLEQVRNLQSLTFNAQVEAYEYQSDVYLLADGRFRVEAPDRTTVHDGQNYWQTFYGIVHQLAGDQLDQYRDVGLRETFWHDFLDAEGNLAVLEHVGKKTARGQTHELLAATTQEGAARTFYLNVDSGLLDKIVELVPDPDLRELKNVFSFTDYKDVGGYVLPTKLQALCITNGEQRQPLTRLVDFKLNEELDEDLFVKPESEIPPASLENGALQGQVVGISGGGSLITSITADDVTKLETSDGDLLVAEVREHKTSLEYMAEIESFGDVGPGDYLATFNNTPTLWLVKAYVGMTSDDSTYAVGDEVRLTVSTEEEGATTK